MAISAYFKKAVLAASLSRGRKITLAGKTYQMKGFFVNTLALKGRTGEREPWLDVVYETVFRCSDGRVADPFLYCRTDASNDLLNYYSPVNSGAVLTVWSHCP